MQDRLKEIQARVDKASGEDWVFDKVLSSPKESEISAAIVEQVQGHAKYRITVQSFGKKAIMADAEFIANAPSDIKFLLAALQEAHNGNKQQSIVIETLLEAIEDWKSELQLAEARERVLREALEFIYKAAIPDKGLSMRETTRIYCCARGALGQVKI